MFCVTERTNPPVGTPARTAAERVEMVTRTEGAAVGRERLINTIVYRLNDERADIHP